MSSFCPREWWASIQDKEVLPSIPEDQCPVCLDAPADWPMLDCVHVTCKQCWEVIQETCLSHKLKCPVCREKQPGTDWVLVVAINANSLDMIKYIMKTRYPHDQILACAIMKGRIEIVKYMLDEGIALDSMMAKHAVRFADLEMVRYLMERGCEVDEEVLSDAVVVASIEVVEYLLEEGCPVAEDVLDYAVKSGRDDVVIRLLEHEGCHMKPTLLIDAYDLWGLDMVGYMMGKGFPTDALLNHAIHHGMFDVVKYMSENGCMLESSTLDFVTQYEFDESPSETTVTVIEYLVKQGCPVSDRVWTFLTQATGIRSPDVDDLLTYLRTPRIATVSTETSGASFTHEVYNNVEDGLFIFEGEDFNI